MSPSVVQVRCPSCGPVTVEAWLAEVHRDRNAGFALATYLCVGCGELGTSTCSTVLADLVRAGVAERRLVCSSPPAATGV